MTDEPAMPDPARQRLSVARILRETADHLDQGCADADDAADTLAILERVYPFEASARARLRWRVLSGREASPDSLAAWMRARAAQLEKEGASG